MIGLDTSFLVAHAIAEHPQHQEAHQWLDSQDDVVNALWLKWLAEFYLGRKRLLAACRT